MATRHSYGATLKNNATESEALEYLSSHDPRLRRPSKYERRAILAVLSLPKSFARAFDLVSVADNDCSASISDVSASKLTLVELKTTKKYLPTFPNGFFFGATENEFQLAQRLGRQYCFCFISLHPESLRHTMLTLDELESRIKTKRIQYQINL